MIRFPNPGSDIGTMVRTFRQLWAGLGGSPNFSLDDMTDVLIANNLATSSGYTGEEALKRSKREDRSRDALFNQSKMYSEVFRVLGWVHPRPETKQRFRFTFLGAEVGQIPVPDALVRESLLGIVYPNPLVLIKGGERVRPFPAILMVADAADGKLGRDEMIAAVLCLPDDRDARKVADAVMLVRKLRARPGAARSAVATLAGKLNVQANTLMNYTRFPLGALRSYGWTEEARDDCGVQDVLTADGHKAAEWVRSVTDIRAADVAKLPSTQRDAVLRLGALQQLARGGLDVPESDLVAAEQAAGPARTALGIGTGELLLTLFQEYDPALVAALFPLPQVPPPGRTAPTPVVMASETSAGDVVPMARVELSTADRQPEDNALPELQSANTPTQAAKALLRRGTNKTVFYPLVAQVLSAAGFPCETNPPGVNYRRADAVISVEDDHVPVEIKSPDEERHLSTKAVRQALENKVIYLSRGPRTNRGSVSLAVGLEPPNDRSEVGRLIEDIHVAFGLKIAVLDFDTLVALAYHRVHTNQAATRSLLTTRGIIEL